MDFVRAALEKIDRTFVVYALIGGFTFCVDMAFFTVAQHVWHWPVKVAATAGYILALALNFLINRTFNFQVHGHFGQQTGKFVIAAGINWLVFVLGVMSLFIYLGVQDQVARILAAMMEGLFLYLAMRLAVFRDAWHKPAEPEPVRSELVDNREG